MNKPEGEIVRACECPECVIIVVAKNKGRLPKCKDCKSALELIGSGYISERSKIWRWNQQIKERITK